MSWKDRLRGGVSDVLGGAIGFVGDTLSDSLEKAAPKALPKNRDGQQNVPDTMPDPAEDGPTGLMVDPFAVIDQLGYKDRPTGITYWTLDEMARRVPVFTAIAQTRIQQVANFAIPQEQDREPGYQVKIRDKKRNPTKAEQARARDIEQWLLHTGSTRKFGKDSFEVFLQKLVRDSLVYDQACFEVVDNEEGEPSDFYALDATTIRIADVPLGADLDDDPERVRHVQIYDDVVIAEFAAHELCFGVRNPRTGIRLNGYGYSELEMMINVITAQLWAFEYNKRFFSQGSATKGLINIRGSIPRKRLQEFRRMWYQMVSGVANAWRTPILNAEELQYINLHSTNRDMEYSAFYDFLIKITSAICLFDPSEINFTYGNTGQTSQMFQAPAEQRIKASKDRGLRPILRRLSSWLNSYLIWRIDEDFEVHFTGIDPRSSDQIADLQKKQVTYLKTVDEIRAEDDLGPLPDGKGEVILDPTWLQFAQAKEMAEQGGEYGGEEEGPPGGGEEEGPPGGEGAAGEEAAGGEKGGGEQGPWGDMLNQFSEMPSAEKHAEKSLHKAVVTERPRRNGTITYEIEV